jgi:YHS domain-containing protein
VQVLAADPVCGMTVDQTKAASVDYQGTKYYFCCQGCATKFKAEPAKYLQPKQHIVSTKALKKEDAKTDYTCPCIRRSTRRGQAVVRSAGWRSSLRRLGCLRHERNTRAQCTRRLSAISRATVQSAVWRLNRAM